MEFPVYGKILTVRLKYLGRANFELKKRSKLLHRIWNIWSFFRNYEKFEIFTFSEIFLILWFSKFHEMRTLLFCYDKMHINCKIPINIDATNICT